MAWGISALVGPTNQPADAVWRTRVKQRENLCYYALRYNCSSKNNAHPEAIVPAQRESFVFSSLRNRCQREYQFCRDSGLAHPAAETEPVQVTSSDGDRCCAWLIGRFIWQQSDKPGGWQTMDEDLSGPRCSCGSGMDDSRLCFAAGSLLAATVSRSAYPLRCWSWGLVTPLILWADRQIRFQQATCPTSSGAFPSEPASDVCVCLFGRFAPRSGLLNGMGC